MSLQHMIQYAHGGEIEHYGLGGSLSGAWKKVRRGVEKAAPMAIGAGLTAMTGGAVNPLTIAALVGTAQGVRTGDLKSGLLAGLGAYGGASMYSSFAAPAAGAAEAGTAATETAGTAGTEELAKSAGTEAAKSAGAEAAKTGVGVITPTPTTSMVNPLAGPNYPPGYMEAVKQKALEDTAKDKVAPSLWDKIVSAGGEAKDFVMEYPKTSALAGLGAIGLAGGFKQPEPEVPKEEQAKLRPYEFDAGYQDPYAAPQQYYGPEGESYDVVGYANAPYTSERQWFNPSYKALPITKAAEGGEMRGLPPNLRPIISAAQAKKLKEIEAKRAAKAKFKQDTEGWVQRHMAAQRPAPSGALLGMPSTFAPQMTGESRNALAYLYGKLRPVPQGGSTTPPGTMPPVTPTPPATPGENIGAYPQGLGGMGNLSSVGSFPLRSKYDFDFSALGEGLGNIRPFKEGGATHLEHGGFVVPADVVSALGNGSSSAGLEILAKRLGAKPLQGPGDGMSDSIPATIGGVRRAAVARDEAYVPQQKVAQVGGSKKLYDMMDKVRHAAHGKPTQQRKLRNPSKLVP